MRIPNKLYAYNPTQPLRKNVERWWGVSLVLMIGLTLLQIGLRLLVGLSVLALVLLTVVWIALFSRDTFTSLRK